MKIIKHGKYESAVKPKYFCCKRCGCEFEADYFEYKSSSQMAYIHDGITAESKCPSCKATVYSYDE